MFKKRGVLLVTMGFTYEILTLFVVLILFLLTFGVIQFVLFTVLHLLYTMLMYICFCFCITYLLQRNTEQIITHLVYFKELL